MITENTTKVADYVAGGYFVTIYANRDQFCSFIDGTQLASAKFLPTRFLSASKEASHRIPDDGAMPYDKTDAERQQSEVLRAGGNLETVRRIAKWVDAHWKSRELEFMDLFTSVGLAREFLHAFFPQNHDLALIGVALHKDKINEFLEAGKEDNRAHIGMPTGKPWEEGDDGYGVYNTILRKKPLEPGGEVLGFELLGYSYGDFDSWLLHDLPNECFQQLGIRPNEFGLLGTIKEANRCAAYVAGTPTKVEPGWWAPWLIVKYLLT